MNISVCCTQTPPSRTRTSPCAHHHTPASRPAPPSQTPPTAKHTRATPPPSHTPLPPRPPSTGGARGERAGRVPDPYRGGPPHEPLRRHHPRAGFFPGSHSPKGRSNPHRWCGWTNLRPLLPLPPGPLFGGSPDTMRGGGRAYSPEPFLRLRVPPPGEERSCPTKPAAFVACRRLDPPGGGSLKLVLVTSPDHRSGLVNLNPPSRCLYSSLRQRPPPSPSPCAPSLSASAPRPVARGPDGSSAVPLLVGTTHPLTVVCTYANTTDPKTHHCKMLAVGWGHHPPKG